MWLLFLQSFFGLMSVCFGESKAPSWKECKIVKKRPYQLLVNVVDCTHKGFKAIPKDAFDFKNATYIKLGHNPYVCDCNMDWFLRGSWTDKLLDPQDIKCAEPAKYKNQIVQDLNVFRLCKSKKGINSYKECKKTPFISLLDCSGLGWESIPFDIFRAQVNDIFLAGNPYNCNCSMKWFIRELKNEIFPQNIADDLLINCSNPPRLAGKFISKLTEDDVCPPKDECATNTHVCHKDAICKNHPSGYGCDCKDGYSGDGKVCIDINECVSAKCPANAHCKNLIGSYKCECNEGYSKNGTQCSDIDECAEKIADCSKDATCQNSGGSYKCTCKAGYNDYYNGRICENEVINPCNSKPSPCADDNEICVNSAEDESFKCVCRDGFARKLRHQRCDDMNECTIRPPCAANAMCKNTFGSYECSCKKGYFGNGKRCIDVDECATDKHNCHRDAVCVNNIGGYKCQCKSGFQELKNGTFCLKKPKVSSVLPIAIVFVVLLLTLIVLGILLYTRKWKKRSTSGEEELISSPQSEKRQEQMFIFDDIMTDLTMEKILPNESAITEWSEYEESEEDQTDNDSE